MPGLSNLRSCYWSWELKRLLEQCGPVLLPWVASLTLKARGHCARHHPHQTQHLKKKIKLELRWKAPLLGATFMALEGARDASNGEKQSIVYIYEACEPHNDQPRKTDP